MTTYTYHDAYLVKFCTTEREGRAADDVAVLAGSATLSAEWTARLVVVQCYILAAMENQADPDDLFAAKLKTYRQQLQALLPQALQAAAVQAQTISNIGLMSIPLERS